MAGRIILETDRLLLREFDESDVEALYRLGSDPEITRYTHDPGGGFANVEQARDVLRSHPIADYAKHGFGRWACVLKADGNVIGFSGLKHLDDLKEVDIGYRFLPEYWGRGLATEASQAALDYGFKQLGLEQIIALVIPENVASVRVLEKLGLKFFGTIDYQSLNVAKYSKVKKDFTP